MKILVPDVQQIQDSFESMLQVDSDTTTTTATNNNISTVVLTLTTKKDEEQNVANNISVKIVLSVNTSKKTGRKKPTSARWYTPGSPCSR